MKKEVKYILVIADVSSSHAGKSIHGAIKKIAEQKKLTIRPLLLVDEQEDIDDNFPKSMKRIITDTSTYEDLNKALVPFKDKIIAVASRSEKKVPLLKTVTPCIPYITLPTETSLTWTTEKDLMRRRLYEYDPDITPAFVTVRDIESKTIELIEENVGYPLVVKPTGLASSLLVSICYHREELIKTLEKTFASVGEVYKYAKGRGEPTILVEQFMEGAMYSVDAYVNSKGEIFCCPPVHVKTGRSIGFDDFFGYQRITPVKLRAENVQAAEEATRDAIRALGLRNVTAHVELMRTEYGWKIIELGPRMGGYRDSMYGHAWGIDHTYNDIKIRLDEKPKIPKKPKGYCAVLEFFAKKEGRLVRIKGLNKVRKLESLENLAVLKKKGDMCIYAKHGGKKVFSVTLFNEKRSSLLADIRRIEQSVEIETTPVRRK